jgi:hypothetical protein
VAYEALPTEYSVKLSFYTTLFLVILGDFPIELSRLIVDFANYDPFACWKKF